jgi:AAHS family 4-hydroxybenzoate transporter-like MFS transporter
MQQRTVDVAEVREGPLSTTQIVVIALCAIVGVIEGYDILTMAYAAPLMRTALGLGPVVLGWIFSISLVGGLCGMIIGGPISDRVGRRPMMIIQTVVFGVFTILSARAPSASVLLVCRFFAGLGLGLTLTVSYAMASEYAPNRLKVSVVSLVTIGYSLGAGVGGVLSKWLIAHYGWPAIFYMGGALALVLAVVLFAVLPESLDYLVTHEKPVKRINAIARKIRPALFVQSIPTFVVQKTLEKRSVVTDLFREGRSTSTLLLWLIFFMNLVELFGVQQWLPTVIHQSGINVGTAVSAGAVLQAGAIVGALIYSWYIDKGGNAFRLFAALFFAGGISFVLLGLARDSTLFVMGSVLLIGMFVLGTQIAITGVATSLFPPVIRATGISWTVAAGRVGGAFGAVISGVLLQRGYTPQQILFMAVIPAMISTVAALVLAYRRRVPEPGASMQVQQSH